MCSTLARACSGAATTHSMLVGPRFALVWLGFSGRARTCWTARALQSDLASQVARTYWTARALHWSGLASQVARTCWVPQALHRSSVPKVTEISAFASNLQEIGPFDCAKGASKFSCHCARQGVSCAGVPSVPAYFSCQYLRRGVAYAGVPSAPACSAVTGSGQGVAKFADDFGGHPEDRLGMV